MTTLTYTGKPGDFNPAAALDRLILHGVAVENVTLTFANDRSAVTVFIHNDPDSSIQAAVEAEFTNHDPSVQSTQQQATAEKESNRVWATAILDGVDVGTLDDTLAALVILIREG
ncbi:MAG: hypothetical protein JXJ17_06355 [Anaerolineae bacterium]|nr:hypothetical protein [Anaerolineae bacterium]